MNLEILKQDGILHIKILHTRLDGDAMLLDAIQKEASHSDGIKAIEFDFTHVEYINSLGITDLVNIHRTFAEENREVQLKLLNVDRKVNAILELVDISKIAEISLAG